MDEQELRAKLEKSLGKVDDAEWIEVADEDWLREYRNDDLSWRDLKGLVEERLRKLRRYYRNKQRADTGDIPTTDGTTVRPPVETPKATVDESILDPRTTARADAFAALDRLRRGPKAWGGASPWSERHMRGGIIERHLARRIIEPHIEPIAYTDGRLPRWVIRLHIEAWVPAEDVKRVYAEQQRKLLTYPTPSQRQPLAYDVARFVWGQEFAHGGWPRWEKLREWWNERHPDQQFSDFRVFRTYCDRGMKATPPKHAHTDEEIISMARELKEWRESPPDIGLQAPPPLA